MPQPLLSRLAMQNAWTAARTARTLFGGSVKTFFAEALRQAWADLTANPVVREAKLILAEMRARRAQPHQPLGLSAGLLAAADIHHAQRHAPGYAWNPIPAWRQAAC